MLNRPKYSKTVQHNQYVLNDSFYCHTQWMYFNQVGLLRFKSTGLECDSVNTYRNFIVIIIIIIIIIIIYLTANRMSPGGSGYNTGT
jgi:hypothetical protein